MTSYPPLLIKTPSPTSIEHPRYGLFPSQAPHRFIVLEYPPDKCDMEVLGIRTDLDIGQQIDIPAGEFDGVAVLSQKTRLRGILFLCFMFVTRRFRIHVLISHPTDSVYHDNLADAVWQGFKHRHPVQLPPHLHGPSINRPEIPFPVRS